MFVFYLLPEGYCLRRPDKRAIRQSCLFIAGWRRGRLIRLVTSGVAVSYVSARDPFRRCERCPATGCQPACRDAGKYISSRRPATAEYFCPAAPDARCNAAGLKLTQLDLWVPAERAVISFFMLRYR